MRKEYNKKEVRRSRYKRVKEKEVGGAREMNKQLNIFWVITLRVVVIYYRRFGTTYRSCPQGSRILEPIILAPIEDGTDSLSRNVGKKAPPHAG